MNRKMVAFALAGAAVRAACAAVSSGEDAALLARAQQLFKPLPADAGTPERPITPERVTLGKALFFEPRLSIASSSAMRAR